MLPVVQLDNKGLYTYANQLSQVPPGAMTIALNCVIDKPGVVETRRGFDFYGTALPSAAAKAFIYMQRLLFYCTGGQLVYDSDGAGTWVKYAGSYFPPVGNFINSTQSNGNLYFTTNNGIYKVAGLTGTPQQAGAPAALDLTATIGVTNSGPINNTSQVAYSVVWGYIDANNNLILGAPSEWSIVVNTSGNPQNATLVASIPAGITTAWFIQVYRTPNTGSASVVPGNNFQLIIEYTPTAGDLTNGYVTLTDTIPDSLLGAYLYTANGQPNPFPNTQPPLCQDICTFNGMTFFLNWQTLQQLDVTMDSVGAPSGVQNGDTFALKDTGAGTTYTYTGAAGNNAAARQFAVVTGGTIAANIAATAQNLAAMINQDPNNTLWYAYYQSGTNILPGSIVITARNLSQGGFSVTSSRTTAWTPALPAAGAAYASGNLAQAGSFIVSPPNQPEAAPLAYNYPVQTGNISIILYRGLALQDALYVFTNAGVFRVTGTNPGALTITLFDSSALIVGLQTPQILNNSIYYNSTQGVCNVSSGGNQIVSRPVERDILQLATLANFASTSFGVSYESDRKYDLFTPTNAQDTFAQQNYVYNWITQAWTLWNRPCTAAIVNPANQFLFVADGSANVFKERKTLSIADYADEHYAITINSVSAANGTLTLASSVNVQIGDLIQQTVAGTQYNAQVTGNNTLTGVVNVSTTTGFSAGAMGGLPATDYRSINTQIQYCPITCGFAEYNKRMLIWEFMFSQANFPSVQVNFSSDYYPVSEAVTLTPKGGQGWDTLPWDLNMPWDVSTIVDQLIPCYPTKNTAIAHWFIINISLTQAFQSLALQGIAGTFEIMSTRSH